ncbi:MAG: TauD/TfdA family dioxygenase [Pseudonocardiaceae bacterium]
MNGCEPTALMPSGRRGWTGDELLRTGAHLYRLDARQLARLARELPAGLLPRHLADLDRVRARVAGPLGDIANTLIDRLGTDGPGLAILTGDGIDRLSDGLLGALLVGLSALIGRPMQQNSDDELVVSVRDTLPADVATARGYLSNGPMLMHTDPTDVAALLCLQASAHGGASLFSSSEAVRDVLAGEAPSEVDMYHRLWSWDLRGMQAPGASPYVTTPIFCEYAGLLSCRFGSLMLREGARATGSLTSEAVAALDRFEDVAKRASLTLRHVLSRGDSVWMDNYRVLHGREEFQDRPDAGCARHLLRIWLWRHKRPELAQELDPFAEAMDWRSRA